MLNLFNRVLGREGPSKEVAKERLRLVLVHDRVGVSPQFLEVLKEDLIRVISQYMEIDDASMRVDLSGSNNSVALVANIPIKRVKRGLIAKTRRQEETVPR